MKTYLNQMITLHANKEERVLHTVTHAEDVVAFRFHSVMVAKDPNVFVYGVTVDARHVWEMMAAVHASPTKAVMADGREVWCGQLIFDDPRGWQFNRKELRLGADPRDGRIAATCQRQEGWIQKERAA